MCLSPIKHGRRRSLLDAEIRGGGDDQVRRRRPARGHFPALASVQFGHFRQSEIVSGAAGVTGALPMADGGRFHAFGSSAALR